MEEVVIDSLLGGGHLRDPQRSMEREAGRFGPEQRIQLDGSSRASHGGFRSLTSFISLEVGVFRALGVQWRVYEYIEGTTVDPEVKSKMKIEVKEQLDVRDANIIRTPDRLWEDLQS